MNANKLRITAHRIVGLCGAIALAPVGAASLTWNGVNGDWTIGTNWTPAGPPGSGDIAIINAGNAALNADTTILALTQGGGTVSGSGILTVTGASTWTAGNQSGTGTSVFDAALAISGASGKAIGVRTVSVGNTTWSGNTGNNNNAIAISGAGIFNNTDSFSDTNTFNSTVNRGNGGGTFNNAGTFDKQSNTTTAVNTVFNNTGTVNVNAGTFLPGGGGTSTGVFNIADGAKLEFRNGDHTLNKVTTSGAGVLQISTENVGADASVVLNGGTHTTGVLLSGSSLSGTDHTFQGAATWTGGAITGAAVTTFDSTLAISGPGSKVISGGRSVSAGTTTWSGNTGNNNNAIGISGAGIFNNTGTFTDNNGFNSAVNRGNGGGTFNNSGIFNKGSNTTTAVNTVFNNTGTVNVNAGTFLPGGGGTSTGLFNIADGAKLEFRNGDHTLNNVTTSGAGLLQISTENVGADASVVLNGGTHTTAVLLSGSSLSGTDHTFQGVATWTGGAIGGAGVTSFANDVSIAGPNVKTIFSGRIVNFNGTVDWSGNTANNNNAIRFSGTSTLNSNGVFNDANTFDSFIEHSVVGPNNFNNVGTYNKQSDTVTTVDLGMVYHNTGTTNVDAGTMRIAAGFTNQGKISVAADAVFHVAAATFGNQGTLQGNGTYQTNSATTVLNNAGILSPGVGDVGALTIVGDYRQTAAGFFDVQLGSLLSFDSLNVLGDMTLDGTVRVLNLGGYNPNQDDEFTIITFDDNVSDASDLTGLFSQMIASGFAPGVTFTAQYFDHSVVLKANVAPIPLPPALWLLGSGLFGLVQCARRDTSPESNTSSLWPDRCGLTARV